MAASSLLFPRGLGSAIVKPRWKASGDRTQSSVTQCTCLLVEGERGWSGIECGENSDLFNHRNVIGAVFGISGIFISSKQAKGAGLPPEEKPRLCDDSCQKELENVCSPEKGTPYTFRVGSGQVIKGLDEGLLTMKAGGLRRLYIPGQLAFPKGLTSAPGRPRVAANSPVIFYVNLLYIPGLESDEEE